LAELDDDLVRVLGGSNDGMFFRQIEVELDAADSSEVDVVLARLRRSGAKPSARSKFSIAISRTPEWEHDFGNQKKRRAERLEQTIAAALRAGLDRLLEHDYRLRVDPRQPRPEDIHQARVAARRLRSDLRTFSGVLDPVWVRHMNDDLTWIGTVLGRVRDVDVRTSNLAEGVAGLGAGGSGFASIQAALDGERDQAAAEAADALRSVRYLDLLDRLDAAQRSAPVLTGAALPDGLPFGPDSKASSALPELVGDQWRALRRKVRKAGRDPDDEALHKIRIRAKRLRYAAETAEPIVGKPAAKTARRAEAIQSVLGDLHDTVTAESWLRDQATRLEPVSAFDAGVLARDQQMSRDRLRRQWTSEWARLARKKNLSWLTG
jgi:CHAD domain-containing protein